MQSVLRGAMVVVLGAMVAACADGLDEAGLADDSSVTEVADALTHGTLVGVSTAQHPTLSDRVDVQYGFDYNPANNHLRGYARILPNSQFIITRLNFVLLGDHTQLLVAGSGDLQTGKRTIETTAVSCDRSSSYRVAVNFTVAWSDGSRAEGVPGNPVELPASKICK